jgi:hypothetical protein
MSWPGGDEPYPDPSANGDRPTNFASLGTFGVTGHLLGFTIAQREQTLKLLSGRFEDLPQLPAFAPLFGYTTEWYKTEVARVILDMAGHMRRLPTPDEADALAYHRSTFCTTAAWAPPAVLLTTAFFVNRGRRTFRFPFYTPKPASFNPLYFPSASRPFLTGPSAVRLWHLMRFGAYGLLCQLLVKSIVISYATTISLTGMLRDDRLKAMRQTPRQNPRQRQHEGRRQDDNRTPKENGEQVQQQLGQPQRQLGQQPPAWQQPTEESPGAPQDDDSFLFDDASPVAQSQRQQPQRPSASSTSQPGQGSAWDRIRQRAKSEEGAPWNPGQQQNGESRGQPRTERYTYSPGEQEKTYAREQAQKEFDAMLERERRGVGQSGGQN